MRRILALALLASFCLAPALSGREQAEWEAGASGLPEMEILSSGDDGLTFTFQLRELETSTVRMNEEEFDAVAIPGGGFRGDVGGPAIPTYTRLVASPEGAEVRVHAEPVEVEIASGNRLFPIQGEDGGDFAYDPEAYARTRAGETAWVTAGEPGRIRDMVVVPLTFEPVRYDPSAGTIEIARRIRVEVEFVGERAGKAAALQPVPVSFDKLYQDVLINYPDAMRGREVVPGSCLYIARDVSWISDRLQPLLDWRERKGARPILETLSSPDTASVYNLINSYYKNTNLALEHVVLVGDADGSYGIPTFWEDLSIYSGEGDHPYTELDGPDVLSDVHIGRISFGSETELVTIVNKIIGYERDPYLADPGWFTRACLVGDPSTSGWSCVDISRWVWNHLAEIGYDQVDTTFSSSDWVGDIRDGLNPGNSIFGYRGWYNMSGWTNAGTYTLSNGAKMPFAVILTCDTGSFASGTSRSEGFLRASTDTVNFKGGIGSIGTATIGTHTRYNNCMYYGIFWGLLVEEQHSMGAALTRGKMEMYLNYNATEPDEVRIWSYWNTLMGDPAVDIWTGYPEALDVDVPSEIDPSANALVVSVSEGGSPVEGALVCAWKGDESYSVGLTDGSGVAQLPITPATEGEMLLTVTGHNVHAYLDTVAVVSQASFVGYADSLAVDDDGSGESSGNGDGVINANETIELAVKLQNFGSGTATGVTATLTTSDPFATIVGDTQSYGDIPAGNSAWCSDDFDVTIDGGCPDGHTVLFGLDVTCGADEWRSLFEVDVASAQLNRQGVTVDDGGGDGALDPGETAGLTIDLRNKGDAPALSAVGTLRSQSAFVTINDGSAAYGDIDVDSIAGNDADPFLVSVDAATYEGYLAAFQLVVEFSGGARDTVEFTLTVGERTNTDPVGPDGYGYYAFDNLDVSYGEAPTFGWIEVDPSLGGDGTEVVLGDNGEYQDKVRVIALPFTFRYYGQEYDTVSVCSNGWIAMGRTNLATHRNWTIPAAGGPDAMIAPFWDDLYQGGGKVVQKYDSSNHRWIIEWSQMKNLYNNATETFETILYDPAHHTTTTGDGLIEFQYQTVSITDPVDGYATVGIESPDQSDGLLYAYFNLYSSGASPLATGRAIRFVPFSESGTYGTLEGHVRNASYGNRPIEGVSIEVVGGGQTFGSGFDGSYSGLVMPGTYDIVASHASFEPDTVYSVVIDSGEATVEDFSLVDIAGPVITTVPHPDTEDETGPYPIPATLVEYSGLQQKVLYYRTNWSGGLIPAPLNPQGGNEYLAQIPGQPYTTIVEYYVYARDSIGLESFDPPGAPADVFRFIVAPVDTIFLDDCESDEGWTIGVAGDDATAGIWVRAEPVGTSYNGYTVQPDSDHTAPPGEVCFVTGNTAVGGGAGDNDVDGGSTTLLSPVFACGQYATAHLTYWVWYTNDRGYSPSEDDWIVQVTGNGSDWVDLENTTASTNAWVERSFHLEEEIALTDNVQLRFIASDVGGGSLVEAAVDDLLLIGTIDVTTGVAEGASPPVLTYGLDRCRPNPFNPETTISFRIPSRSDVDLEVYDVSGRLVRTLLRGSLPAGEHSYRWDGTNGASRPVSSGVYFVRLSSPGFTEVRQVTLVR